MGLPLGLRRTLTPTSACQLREKAGRGHHCTGGHARSLSASPRNVASSTRSRRQGLGSSSSAHSLPSAVGGAVEPGWGVRAGRLGGGRPSTPGCDVFEAGPWPPKGHTGSGSRSEPVNHMGVILSPAQHAPAWVTPTPHSLPPARPVRKRPPLEERLTRSQHSPPPGSGRCCSKWRLRRSGCDVILPGTRGAGRTMCPGWAAVLPPKQSRTDTGRDCDG